LPEQPFIIEIDASDIGIGAVLSRVMGPKYQPLSIYKKEFFGTLIAVKSGRTLTTYKTEFFFAILFAVKCGRTYNNLASIILFMEKFSKGKAN